MHTTVVVWMSTTVHARVSQVAQERFYGAPSIKGAVARVLPVDGGFRLALVKAAF